MPDTAFAVAATISCVLWIFAIISIIVLLKRFFMKSKSQKIKSKINMRLAVTMFVFQLLGGVWIFYLRICGALINYDVRLPDCVEAIRDTADMIGIGCIFIAFTLVIFIFVARLKTCFGGTPLDYPPWFYITISSEIIFVTIFIFIARVLFEEFPMITGVGVFLAILNCILCTLLFIHSLKKIMKPGINEIDETLVEIMTKFVGLALICFGTSFLFCLSLLIGDIHIIAEFFHVIIQPVDVFSNVFCVYLQFNFTVDDYNKWFRKYHVFIRYMLVQTDDETKMQSTLSIQAVQSNSSSNSMGVSSIDIK